MNFLNAAIMTISLIVMPFSGQKNTLDNTVSIVQETNYKPHFMYAITGGVNIRKSPDLESTIVGQTLTNTQFQVIGEYDGWFIITTENGYAYISSQYLSDTPIKNRWNVILDEAEKDLLARIVMLEAGNQSDKGQQAVTEVILNRLYSEEWPDTLYGVLSQKNQFTTWKNRNSKRAIPTEQVVKNINLVLSGNTNILPMNTVYFSCDGENSKIETIIGDHVFCNR